jgi:hypothetical protein
LRTATRSLAGKALEACPNQGERGLEEWNTYDRIGRKILYFEAQENGKLPRNHRVKWRGDSY